MKRKRLTANLVVNLFLPYFSSPLPLRAYRSSPEHRIPCIPTSSIVLLSEILDIRCSHRQLSTQTLLRPAGNRPLPCRWRSIKPRHLDKCIKQYIQLPRHWYLQALLVNGNHKEHLQCHSVELGLQWLIQSASMLRCVLGRGGLRGE